MVTAAITHAAWLKAPETQKLLAALEAARAGGSRFVGGCVRNTLLGAPVDDLDIATQLTPPETIAVATKAGFAAHPTGIEHGTITVVVDHRRDRTKAPARRLVVGIPFGEGRELIARHPLSVGRDIGLEVGDQRLRGGMRLGLGGLAAFRQSRLQRLELIGFEAEKRNDLLDLCHGEAGAVRRLAEHAQLVAAKRLVLDRADDGLQVSLIAQGAARRRLVRSRYGRTYRGIGVIGHLDLHRGDGWHDRVGDLRNRRFDRDWAAENIGAYLHNTSRFEAAFVIDRDGRIRDASIIRALRWLYENTERLRLRVVNLSVVGDGPAKPGNPIDTAASALVRRGVTVVTSGANA